MNPTYPLLLSTIHRVYDQACARVLAASGGAVTLQPREPAIPTPEARAYVSVVSATAAGMTLLSVVNADRDVLVETHPLRREDAAALDVADWCLELNNHVMGRMKNALLELGCHLTYGVPALLTDVRTVMEPGLALHARHVAFADAGMTLTLAARLADGAIVTLPPSPSEVGAVMHHGGVLF
jgi:hypothetical protein